MSKKGMINKIFEKAARMFLKKKKRKRRKK